MSMQQRMDTLPHVLYAHCFSAFCFSLCAHLLGTPLRCLLMVITQQAAQSLAALNMPVAAGVCTTRGQPNIALPLVISLGMEMFSVFPQRSPQRALAQEEHLPHALPPPPPHPAPRTRPPGPASRK